MGYGTGPDKTGRNRKTIRFNLIPVGQVTNIDDVGTEQISGRSLKELRVAAIQSVSTPETGSW